MTAPDPQTAALVERMAELERAVARDLDLIAHPRLAWLRPRTCRGAPVLDVLVVGAGQSGLAIAFGLRRSKVDNVLVIDRARYGREGPWITTARMPELRSWKDQTGPDLNVPSLTYQSWHEAQWGAADFAAMRMIPVTSWNDYLLWFRRATALPVRNDTALTGITPDTTDDGLPCLRAALSDGMVFARKIVLATGQDGTGHWWMPDYLAALPRSHCGHTSDDIDFAGLRAKTVAVLGAGASAFDNAAVALEHGAASATIFCRRAEPMVVQPFRWLTFAGFLKHLGDMPDEWRWRFMHHIMGLREGFPADTYARVKAFPNFALHVGRPWRGASIVDGRVAIETATGPFVADFVIAGTGVMSDLTRRPELAACAANIATWADRYDPPADLRSDRLGRFPYLAPDYAFVEREPGRTPWVRDLHCFNIGATLSFGPSGSSINAMTIAVPKLVDGLTRGLFRTDLAEHWESLRAYDVPQVVL